MQNNNHQFTEAPASLTIKVSYRGFNDILFTLRDSSGAALLDKLDTVLNRLDAMGAAPAPGRNGYAANAANGGPGPLCPTHKKPMKPSKNGGWFCPQKLVETGGGADGSRPIYCRVKVEA